MKSFLLLLIIVLTAPFLQNCGTPDTPTYECTPDITVPFPQDALDRFYFKTGSWWVYEEINNPGIEDSMWVETAYQISEIPDPDQFGSVKTRKCYDFHHVQMHSLKFGILYQNCRIGSVSEGFNYESEYFRVTKTGEMANFVTTCIASMDGNEYRPKNCNKNLVSMEDSLMVQGNLYLQVLKVTKDIGTMDFLDEAWYVRNIGLIKYKRADGAEWELVRYHIVQ